ncbi:hypothetical protein E3J79_02425 [Candidatus Dependentiae bacterium]|nr:MAG: hypothetical protein E3J79_02425 [Candidatus Dependentiae bacterium]
MKYLCYVKLILLGNLLLVAPSLFSQKLGIRLIGIYNNLTRASNIPSRRPPAVSIKGTNFTDVIGKPLELSVVLPIEISLRFNETISEQPYTIRIEESPYPGDCPGHKARVTATVLGYKGISEAEKSTCVNKAILYYIPKRKIYEWQNVFLALGDNPDYEASKTGSLPFKFAISAWSSTKYPWNKKEISHPSDTRKITFRTPLKIIQGQQAWGGGNIPRLVHANIVHLYNNTDYIINMNRYSLDRVLSKYNFEKLIPPKSVIPFAMVWIPKIPSDRVYYPKKSEIQIFALKAASRTALPPIGFQDIAQVGAYEMAPTAADVDEILDNMIANMTKETSQIMEEPDIEDLTKGKYDRYFIGKNFYRLFNAIDKNKTIYIQSCPIGKEEEAKNISTKAPAYKNMKPEYFKLIINQGTKGAITFDLSPIPFEQVDDF